MDTAILINGAGPTGLTLALRLLHHGVPFRIIDRNGGPGQASRAMAVQARTLEFYDQLGLADDVVGLGIKAEAAHMREHGQEVARLSWTGIGKGVSPYPFVLCFPQDDHERFLVDQLVRRGVDVEWNTTLQAFRQDGTSVRATLARNGAERSCEAAYLVGCDGAHTTVRPALGIGFPGGTYEQLFYVADVKLDRPLTGDITVTVGPRSLVLLLPVRSSGMWRLIGIVPPELRDREDVTFDDVRPTAEALLGLTVSAVNWFSHYRVHHRVADRFREDRVFIAGDAGHLHSPAGGQGMNTGIGDAVNLAWKLADVVRGRADPAILDSYEAERIPFARKLVATTDRAFSGMVGEGWSSNVLRGWIIPRLVPAMSGVPAVRRRLFETLSQTRIAYRNSALSEGRAGAVRGGDRMPWTGGNYALLRRLGWQVHVYGQPAASFAERAAALGLPVEAFAWSDAAAAAGLARGAAYLLRPDGHVALADPNQDGAALQRYAARIGLTAAA